MARIVNFPGNPDWARKLILTDNGLRHKSVHNSLLLLENLAPAGAFRLNTYADEIEVSKPLPWSSAAPRVISEIDITHTINWLEEQGQFGINEGLAFSVLKAIAAQNSYDPLQDWLLSLRWDHKSRIDNFLGYYFGCDDTEYARLVGPKFLLGAVARALKPGCKFDCMLILEGPQGALKSSSMEALFGKENFTDEIADFGSKDAALQLQGVWCVEVAELSTFGRAAADRAKEFLSRKVDRFRPPYGRVIVKRPRRAILVGTTNADAPYFQDHTGNRRYWPVEVANIDLAAIRHDRDQLWAEAVHRIQAGERWWLEETERDVAASEQSDRYDEDVWHDHVSDYVDMRTAVTVQEILTDKFKFEGKELNQQSRNRVQRCLSVLGWECKKPTKVNGKTTRLYRRKGIEALL